MTEHLESCSRCREELDSLRATISHLRQLPQHTLPRSFTLAGPPPQIAAGRSDQTRWVPAWAYAGAASLAAPGPGAAGLCRPFEFSGFAFTGYRRPRHPAVAGSGTVSGTEYSPIRGATRRDCGYNQAESPTAGCRKYSATLPRATNGCCCGTTNAGATDPGFRQQYPYAEDACCCGPKCGRARGQEIRRANRRPGDPGRSGTRDRNRCRPPQRESRSPVVPQCPPKCQPRQCSGAV